MRQVALSRPGALLACLLIASGLAPAAADEAPAPRAEKPELDALEQEVSSVMDALIAARVRADVVARSLFRTELVVELVRRAERQRLGHLTLRLDGAPIHDSDGSAIGKDRVRLYAARLAPGMHELGVEIRESSRDAPDFRYVRSESYRIDVKKERRTRVELVLRDDSDMAEEAREGDDGTYEVETSLRVRYERAGD